MKLQRVALSIALLCLSFAAVAGAHPGRLDERGGHNCHTNCAKWGLDDGEYRYHRSQAKFLPPSDSENSGDTDAGLDLEEDSVSTNPSPQEAAAIDSIRVNLPLFDVIVNGHRSIIM
ncbi:hypothetical protein P4H70_13750 [Paenibacillus ehimensis]|uniref:hypothetical protein n=2 Tax=Paenibacillus ehimensis TaxID=79264 RepID=UPI002DB7BED0|nr:hypothetical protein [Paenibacillus ehimensis]MEC0209997.1 hypothetical protein [Paenibacillus ehimensis]